MMKKTRFRKTVRTKSNRAFARILRANQKGKSWREGIRFFETYEHAFVKHSRRKLVRQQDIAAFSSCRARKRKEEGWGASNGRYQSRLLGEEKKKREGEGVFQPRASLKATERLGAARGEKEGRVLGAHC